MKYFIIFVCIFALIFPAFTKAFSFDKNYLMSDDELNSCNIKDESHVQKFLEEKGSFLASYSPDGQSAARIIAREAEHYNVSACWILATLQKEQSLITIKDPEQGRLDWAMGYACPSGGGCNPKYKGFEKQVRSASAQIEEGYRQNPENYTFQVGKETKTEDGEIVKPKNFATAANYNYTPVVGPPGGNYLLVKAWSDFGGAFVLKHPAGFLIKRQGSGAIYLTVYEDDQVKKSLITNLNTFKAQGFSMGKVITVAKAELDSLPNSIIKISYPDGMLIKGSGTAIYAMDQGRRRHIASPQVAKQVGLSLQKTKKISDAELTEIPGGPKLSNGSQKISGTLVKTKNSSAIYYVENGKLRHITDMTVFKANNYSFNDVEIISDQELKSFKAGASMSLKDGTIIKNKEKPGIYISENGRLKLVRSMNTFKNLGLQMGWVKTVSQKFIDISPRGEGIN